MAKRFTDSQLKGLKPQNKRKILYEDGGKGFGIRVEPSGRKSFFLEYRFGKGKERRNRVLTIGQFPIISLTKARSIASHSLDQIEQGDDPATQKIIKKTADRNALTVNDLVEEYLDKWAKVKKKERSWKEDERLLRKDIIPVMGRKKAKDIRRRDIALLLDEIVDRGAAITANRVLAVTRKMFNFAVGRDIIDASPCVQIPAPSKENRRERNLSEDEVSIFWNKLDDCKMSKEIKLALKLLLITAQRKSEVIEAEWNEFNFKDKWWTIPKTKTKNKKSHRVPLPPIGVEVLNEMKKITGEYKFVFASPIGMTKRNPNRRVGMSPILGASVDHALRDNLIDDPDSGRKNIFHLDHFTPHDLRRTATSMMSKSGIPRLTLKKILNHSDGEVTAVYDQYEYDKEKKKALEKWGRKLQSIISGESPRKIVDIR